MLLIDDHLTDLAAGFRRIRQANRKLKDKWRQRLLAAYKERREAYEIALSAHRQRLDTLKPKMLMLLAVAAGLVAIGLFISWMLDSDSAWLSSLLVLTGLVAGGVLSIVWLWKTFIAKPKLPQHPLREPLKSTLFPPLISRWRRTLQGEMPKKMPYEGAKGEYDFVRKLQQLRSVNGYLIYRLQQNYGDDIDVTFVGSKGIWAFEVKYWSGTITWYNGQWAREKSYYESGGVLVTEEKAVNQAPDRQWQRMADDIVRTLEFHTPALLRRVPALSDVKGGIVFTHPKASYNIASNAPFAWGTIAGWRQALADAQPVPGLDEQTIFQVIDTLLQRHHEVSDIHQAHSLDAHAQTLIQEVEKGLRRWVQQ